MGETGATYGENGVCRRIKKKDTFADERRVEGEEEGHLEEVSNFRVRWGEWVCDIWEEWGWRETKTNVELNSEIWEKGVCGIWAEWVRASKKDTSGIMMGRSWPLR